jgi:DNA-binding response OmpR family regulator
VVGGDPVGFRQLFTNLIENAVRHGGRPDLSVTVEGRIRADTALQTLPVVVLTSSERDDDREGALRLGATWYVCKPVEGARFRAEVQQLGDRWAAALA